MVVEERVPVLVVHAVDAARYYYSIVLGDEMCELRVPYKMLVRRVRLHGLLQELLVCPFGHSADVAKIAQQSCRPLVTLD